MNNSLSEIPPHTISDEQCEKIAHFLSTRALEPNHSQIVAETREEGLKANRDIRNSNAFNFIDVPRQVITFAIRTTNRHRFAHPIISESDAEGS